MSHPRTEPEWAEETGHLGISAASEVSGLAITALILGVLGFACFPGVGGIAAIAFGIAARSDIAQSEGRRSGMGLANAGIVTGAASVALTVVALAATIALIARPRPVSHHPPPPPATGTKSIPPGPVGSTPTVERGPSSGFHRGVRAARLGTIYLVDLGPEVQSLDDELDRQRDRAKQEDRKLLLWVSRDDCHPCNGVAAALRDDRLQQSLSDTLIVRVDVRDYQADLDRLGIPTQFVPGFALLDTDNRPVDYLHGGEWDDDLPQNIAPILDRFVRGTYAKRRYPWHTLPDANATPI